MANKAPKKKESREQVNQTSIIKEAAITTSSLLADDRNAIKRKPPIPLWVEWNDQDIANEKWDNGKQQKDRGKSPTATTSCFEDAEGKIDLPSPIKAKVHSWKRPCEIFNDKVPTVVNPEHVYEPCIDLLAPNEHITDSELIRHIISTFTSLYEIFASSNEPEVVSSIIKMKASISKDNKDAKVEKGKRDEYFDEMGWRPWYQIWPKEGAKGNNIPCYNPQGKYAVKIFWMGCYRKIIVDDSIPCDENLKPLLPLTSRGNEIWVLILAKALIKVASLDYYGGLSNSEFGDSNIIHCLTGWLPESIPLEVKNYEKIWNLLLTLLPHWTLPLPHSQKFDDCNLDSKKSEQGEMEVPSKQELVPKESKDKTKKDDKVKDDKRMKGNEKVDKENKANKEKPLTPAAAVYCKKLEQPTPDFLLFATFLNPPPSNPPCKFSDFKEMANISEKLRQFGLCQYLSHPVHLNSIRICPLVPPPEPLKIPRWRLIRQKKNRELVEPKLRPEQKEKEPKFLELKSTLFNFKVNIGDNGSPINKTKPLTKIPSISEEVQVEVDECPTTNDVETAPPIPDALEINTSNAEGESAKKINRSLSVTSSQSSLAKKSAKSKQDNRKSAQKDKNNVEKKDSRFVVIEAPQSLEEQECPDILPEATLGHIQPTPEDNVEKEKEKEEENENTVWMDFDDFLQCFSTLWIYHKPKKNMKNIADIKCFDQRSEKARKSAGHNISDMKNVPSPSGIFGGITSDSLPPFLLVDCVHEAEVIIHFSSFSRWFDPNLEFMLKKEGTDNDDALRKASTPIPGTLMVEPYFWKQIVTPSPLLRMSTTGVKSAVLTLPPGRHVLRFMINTPLGYHICITSSQNFIFDDEHVVMQHLTKVSARFVAHAVDVLKQLKVISQSFNDKSIPRSCGFIIGTEEKPSYTRREHFDVLHSCLAVVLKSELGDNFQTKMKFALNALKFESYFHMPRITPESKMVSPKSANDATTCSPSLESSMKERYSLPALQTLTGSDVHEVAAIKLQSTFKGFYIRKLVKAYHQDSKENKVVNEMLDKIWNYIDVNIEAFATKIYVKLFEENHNLYTLFPFYADECNKVNYNDYNGSYPEPPNTTWFLMFREIFYVLDSNLIFPKFYCNIQNYQLKVIDNDTVEELKTLFSKVVPQVLHKNKHGYTFVATAWNHSYVPGGKFRLRIIGENDVLPIPVKEGSVTTHFVTKEIKDYYLPNRYNRIFRQTLKLSEDVLSSIQFTTSKEDVYIKLQVLDDEEVIYTCEGKRTLIIPALIFYKDRFPPADGSKNSRSSSQAGSIASLSKTTNPKQSTRRTSSPEKHKRKLLQLADLNMEEDILEEQIHKYIVEGFVLRDSWPLTRKEWIFVENQKNTEKLDKETSTDSVGKVETVSRGSAGKSRKNTRQESRGTKIRPPSQTQNTFDITKANWTLRFIIDANMENAIEIKRDTQRDEEIKAIKAAWETMEPGRATKALLSRQKYLESHTTVVSNTAEEKEEESTVSEDGSKEKSEEEAASVVTSDPVAASDSPLPSEPDTGELFYEPPMKENLPILTTFDATPYIRSNGKKVILDEYEEEVRQGILQSKFTNFHEVREMVLQMRENNRISRNLKKEKQLAEYEKMQVQLDEARIGVYKAREAYRNKFIPQPSAEAEPEVEKKKKTPSPKAKASKSRAKKK